MDVYFCLMILDDCNIILRVLKSRIFKDVNELLINALNR